MYTLKKGMFLNIGGLVYKVRSVRRNGKIVIQYKGVASISQQATKHIKKIGMFGKMWKFLNKDIL